MLAGSMEHRDHMGNRGLLSAGSVQWMTAGRGIVHSEMPRQEQGLMWGFQLWVNLPASQKLTDPRYQDIPPERIPSRDTQGARIRVVAGRSGDVVGPVAGIVTEPLYLDVTLDPAVRFTHPVPAGHTAFVHVFEGEAAIEGTRLARGQLAVLGDGASLEAEAGAAGARFLLVAARPLGEPIARYGPFVMNTEAELEQAFADFRAGRF